MCILLTPVLYFITTVIIDVYLQRFTESVSLRDIDKPTSRAEISSPSSLYLTTVKGAHIGSALTGATSELTNSNHKKNSHKTHYSHLRKKIRNRLYNFLIFLHFKKRATQPQQKDKKQAEKMNHHIGQTSSKTDTHSDELQLVVLTQQNKRLLRDILPFGVKHYRHQDELNLLLNTAKQLKYHYFAV